MPGVGSKDLPVYASTGDPAHMTPVRYLPAQNTWVSIKQEIAVDSYRWYRIGEEEYVLASDVWVGSPSTFRGVPVEGNQRTPFGLALVNELNARSRPDIEADSLYQLARYQVLPIRGWTVANGENWYLIGRDEYVKADYVRVVARVGRPEGVPAGEKWIAVNLAEQTLAAYEGDRMVFATLVSTGLPWWQTPEGLFRIGINSVKLFE